MWEPPLRRWKQWACRALPALASGCSAPIPAATHCCWGCGATADAVWSPAHRLALAVDSARHSCSWRAWWTCSGNPPEDRTRRDSNSRPPSARRCTHRRRPSRSTAFRTPRWCPAQCPGGTCHQSPATLPCELWCSYARQSDLWAEVERNSKSS